MSSQLSRILGTKSRYISFYRTIRAVPFNINTPIFGQISSLAEVLNIHDNFGKGELRDDKIEKYLSTSENPLIVDCGVNVGVTVRWWKHLNKNAQIIGIDMMEEAHIFTKNKLKNYAENSVASESETERVRESYYPVTAALAAIDGERIEISFNDPLHGENSVASKGCSQKRIVTTKTLDTIMSAFGNREIDLLKIDIEGHGAEALKGGKASLFRTHQILFETHNETELSEAVDIIMAANFRIRGMRSRTLIFERRQS